MNIQKSLYTARWAGAHSDSQALPLQGTGESLTVEACPTSQGWTDRRKQLQKWLPSNTFPACPRPGLSAEFQVHRERKREFRTFSYPEKNQDIFPPRWGEGVGSLVSHPGSHKGDSRHRRAQPFPNTHLPPVSWAGTLARGAGADGCDGAAESRELFLLLLCPGPSWPWGQTQTRQTDMHTLPTGLSLCTNTR